MPELPEVETIVQGLNKQISHRKIHSIKFGNKKLRIDYPKNIREVQDATVIGVTRRSKYILIELDNGNLIVFHLGMSGKLLFLDKPKSELHDHVVVKMTDKYLVFNDPRRFGLFTILHKDEVESHKLFANLGVEPLSEGFTPVVFRSMLSGKKCNIKSFIMNAKYIVGVGNIYASESLFLAKINPLREAGSLKNKEIKALLFSIQNTLRSAIKSGGSTLRDYVRSDGDIGGFQHHFKVYDKAGNSCSKCGALIKKIVISNRSTYYCSACQS